MQPVALITGTTHGIGRVTARELARAGCSVVMLCRNLQAAQRVRAEILVEVAAAAVDIVRCDLASLDSVRAAAAEVRRRFGPITLLINNAGMVSSRRRMSVDGFELTFASNHLGPFLLTELLLEHLSATARIINVASRIHYRGRIDFTAITDPRARYRGVAAYAQSKLANVLYTFELARRLAGTARSVNCLHPGVVASNLLPRWLRLVKPLISRVIFDCERGARTTLYLALSDSLTGTSGRYFDENQAPQPAAPQANDPGLQHRLWQMSAGWVGQRTPGPSAWSSSWQ
ncbi:MAG: SDR family NAD(P)-dependent oxidoreductase [Steroidobacteraceae bacterium]